MPFIELLDLPFFQRALLVGTLLSLIMAPVGVIVVLRGMAFFADAIGHSALAGIALGLLLSVNPFLAALAFAIFVAYLVGEFKHRTTLAIDTLLGMFFPAAMALGVIIVQFIPGYRADLISFLFGDILTVSRTDVIMSSILLVVLAAAVLYFSKRYVLLAFNEELAHTAGIPVKRYETFLLIALAALVAIAIKFVGIVLVTALLVMPAATAQQLTSSVTMMVVLACVISVTVVVGGMVLSALLMLPSGPVIVLFGATLFFGAAFGRGLSR